MAGHAPFDNQCKVLEGLQLGIICLFSFLGEEEGEANIL